ncbi:MULTISPECIES: Sec-independent protein translocase subunit TatA [unclassified Dietzia]|uniref:Sec-independent protein translocase subunit TatA n=1 Tax=unclassified Dietzia TaxID=2617939 RepID=UPI000D22AFAE|nr:MULTISPECIES: Sec-independent protein translocase subunit TatA [unclassified Dietzia]AVZ39401.1 twin-arginine translocase TatA/TatE family subunit [Dietzia sp. JS16-p6b]MBB1024199.1 Sec-independent protein translocase subunit TatA [Dietzia sp. DQ12-76]MBB1027648.1 Sec-independent protein translocase subunit TatA [Dietzia sp. DQ11-38-2]QGW24666.1 twin arginine translocase protein A [Dietzia sp. DQ12-45-1b]
MGALSIWHWLIVLAVVLLLFGSKKLPDAARGLGRSMRIFKSEIKEMQNDDKPAEPEALTQAGQPNAAQYVQPQAHPTQAQHQAQGYPQAPQQPYQQQGQSQQQYQHPPQTGQQYPQTPQQGQQHQQSPQHVDPTGPYDGGTGTQR